MTIKSWLKKLIKGDPSPDTLTVGKGNESNRVEWLKSTLAKIPSGSRILDAGAGEQQFRKFCSHLTYVSQDFAQYKPDEVRAGLQMEKWDYGNLDLVCDIASIPEPEASFDAVMCTEVFEHIINPREAIKEFSRLIRKDGYLVITAPFSSLTHFAPYHFYTGFNRYFYETELAANDFKILEIQPNGNYFEFMGQEVRRIQSIGKNYSATVQLSGSDKQALQRTLNLLQRLSFNDAGSAELLCFGYHVFAQKQ